jgi:hypothetical protein
MKNKYYYLIILLSFYIIILSSFSVYGLDEFVDDYLNETHVQAIYQTRRNSTFNCMELNYSVGIGNVNFSDGWNEQDEENDITIYDYNITWVQMDRDTHSHVDYDYGVDYWGDDWTHIFQFNINGYEAGDANNRNALNLYRINNDWQNFAQLAIVQQGADDTQWTLQINQRNAGGNIFVSTYVSGVPNKDYWVNLTKTGANFRIQLYNNSAMTVAFREWDNTDIGLNVHYRYIYFAMSPDSLNDPDDWTSGYVKDFNYGNLPSYFADGYFYTDEVLSGLINNTICLLTNSSIPSGSITVEFSNDNATWRDHNGNVGSDTLIAGYESLDLRDLNYTALYMRYNYTRGLLQETPRIYQIRVIVSDPVSGGGGFPFLIGILILSPVFLILIVVLVKKK